METKNYHEVEISRVQINPNNPRTITERNFERLVNSLLGFPKMLRMRPIACDGNMMVLGGNMRLRALQHIAEMKPAEILDRISQFELRTDAERDALANYWQQWQKNPTVPVTTDASLTDGEKNQFIIADNVSFGDWDWGELANSWDANLLNEWGLDNWGDADAGVNDGELPGELQGLDLTPDELKKIDGDGETDMARVIIVFPKERADDMAALLGVEGKLKVVYKIDELINE
jgi:hypothetical protein